MPQTRERMRRPRTIGPKSAERFFWDRAGYCHATNETPEEGREQCARNLAAAERHASDNGWTCRWVEDDTDSSDFSDEQPPWTLWICTLLDESGESLGSLCGIDFGRDREPWGDPYRRVVEAELALDAMD